MSEWEVAVELFVTGQEVEKDERPEDAPQCLAAFGIISSQFVCGVNENVEGGCLMLMHCTGRLELNETA